MLKTTDDEDRWLPLEAVMARDGITPSDLLQAERAGAHIPAVNFKGLMVVDQSRLFDWRELVKLSVGGR